MKLCIVIPAYNEEKIIGKTLDTLPKKIPPFKEIIKVVVDDGSGDQTFKIAKKRKVVVLKHILNRGLGAALKTGLDYAKKQKADVVVTFDADGQHHHEDLIKVLVPIINHTADVVIGSRFKDQTQIPKSRKLVNFAGNIATLIFFGIWTTDSQSGLRALSKKSLNSINLKGQRMEVSSEFFKEIKINKLKFKEVPIKTIYTDYSIAKGQRLSNSFNILTKISFLLFR